MVIIRSIKKVYNQILKKRSVVFSSLFKSETSPREKRKEQKKTKTIKLFLASGVGRFLSGVRESAAGNVTRSCIRYIKKKLRETG